MSENKFIKQLQGKSTKKSVLEIKKSGSTTSFANMPNGTSNSINTYSDSRDDAVAVLKGAENWKLATNSLQLATTVNGDGRDFVSTYTAFGNTTWVNATYTFDSSKRFAPHTKFVLKLCGHSLQSSASKIIGFTLLVKFGNDIIMTKNFDVAQEAFEFCKNFDIDFGESNNDFIKVENNDTMTVQLLCQDSSASATIYNGMTVFTVLQRRVDSDSISSDTYTMEEIEEDLEEIHQELNGKVNIDGTSIMTGPLKMRSSISFKCAIAPSWDGVGFYKLNDNDSLTLMASMETTDGLCPATNNTYNIGKTSHKWKDLYLAGKAYVATINNGGDIAVPTISGTMALMSDVELAANSGSQLYTTGVWYAKMYAATVVPTGAEYDGKNYADFSQVDQDNNPIIVIYEGQNGSWVQVDTITPPATYNGYLYITSKIWDIVEQTNQQGGQVLWSYSQKTFTPYPRIVSVADLANTDLSNLSTTGKANVSAKGTYDPGTTYTSGTVGAELAKIAGKADAATTLSGYGITDGANTDLSNLTDTGKNIANWSSNVSNCITEIPQDVKLELNNGTLTLKAGSKVYVPNGAGVFNEVVIASDINISMGTG
ncbi:MAG: hypothetical protein J6S67_14085, partial [Methanobrevibacter sp.]|nr:hypothetical protein [Methanobrevibacter sp.]